MDSKKLARIIKLIVEQELKKQLPKLVKEGVAKVLTENKKNRRPKTTSNLVPNVEEETDMFTLAESMLDNERATMKEPVKMAKSLSKNPILNEILNETKPFREAAALDYNPNEPLNEDFRDMDKTVSLDSNGAQGGLDAVRANMAAKMGYGDMPGVGASPQGLGVQTGVPVMDKVLNRDYSELVKKFKTRK